MHTSNRWFFAAALLCAVMALAPGPAQARHPDLELDDLDDDDLGALILAEVDDDDLLACGIGNLNGRVSVQRLFNAVMCALGDGGDSGSERGLDFDDLEDEMEEAGTTVAEVVMEAIEEADEVASGERHLPAGIVAVVHRAHESPAGHRSWNDIQLAVDDQFVDPLSTFRPMLKATAIGAVRAKVFKKR